MTEAPSPFSTTIPDFQIAWDSTSLGWLKECPKRYYYEMILGYEPRSRSIHLTFGGWYASGVERYAHARADGLDHDAAVYKMVRWALGASGERIECADCAGTGQQDRSYESFECPACKGVGSTWQAWESGDPIKNRYTLLRSLIWNVDARRDAPFRTHILANGKPAVELSFNFPLYDYMGHTISLAGHLDSVVEFNGGLWVLDDKTTKGALNDQFFKNFSPNNQMSLYMAAGQIILSEPVAGVLVRGAQIGVGFTRFATRPIPRAPAVVEEWIEDTKYWIGQAYNFAVAQHWPMNDKSCTSYGGCPFARVCSVSPSHRAAWLKEDFVPRFWNPLDARGDI